MVGGAGRAESPLLVALDLPTAEEAVRMARRVAPHVGGFKVGLELLMGPGPATVAALAELGKPVFADAKLHDIPTTAERAARRLGEHGARWVTAHALGGEAALRSARRGLREGSGGRPAGILAVTVLTSLRASDLAATGLGDSVGKAASRLARLARAAGCEGVVCSPRELSVVGEVAPGLLRVTPGIRTEEAPADDQARVATPERALGWGADYLVVGRPITAAADPAAAAEALALRIAERSTMPGSERRV